MIEEVKIGDLVMKVAHRVTRYPAWPGDELLAPGWFPYTGLYTMDEVMRMSEIDDQPPPQANASRPVWELVIDDMRARDHVGRKRYGTPLQAFNGRDALVDAYQEALDQCVYLRQAIEERRSVTLGASIDMVGPNPIPIPVVDKKASVYVTIILSRDGTPVTGLGSLDYELMMYIGPVTVQYCDDGKTDMTPIKLVKLLAVYEQYTPGGFFEVDSTKNPGQYRIDIPEEAFDKCKVVNLVICGTSLTTLIRRYQYAPPSNSSFLGGQ